MDAARVFLETIGTEAQLIRRLLAGDVERCNPLALESRGTLHQQRGFADARLAADERHRTRNDPAAEDEIEFGEARAPARGGCLGDGGEADRRIVGWTAPARLPIRRSAHPPLRDRLLNQGVPRAARVALAAPFGLVGATFGAAKDRAALMHSPPPVPPAPRPPGPHAPCSCQSACIPS